jgi:hypothetical protein
VVLTISADLNLLCFRPGRPERFPRVEDVRAAIRMALARGLKHRFGGFLSVVKNLLSSLLTLVPRRAERRLLTEKAKANVASGEHGPCQTLRDLSRSTPRMPDPELRDRNVEWNIP